MGIAAAAGITAAAGLAGGLMQSSSIKKGQSDANQAQQMAAAIQRNDLMPYATQGLGATTRAADLLNLNGQPAADAALANYRTSPGYQWQMDQGLRAVDAGAAAKGMLRSGATLKAEQTFGAGLADSDFGAYYNRLFDLGKLGESAAAGQGAGAIQTAQGIAQTDASAAGAQSSIYGNMAKGLSAGVNDLFGSSNTNSLFGGTAGNSSQYNVDPLRMGIY
jgi:hypothetical protein